MENILNYYTKNKEVNIQMQEDKIYHISHLEDAVKSFKQSSTELKSVVGKMTIEEFILKYNKTTEMEQDRRIVVAEHRIEYNTNFHGKFYEKLFCLIEPDGTEWHTEGEEQFNNAIKDGYFDLY